MEHLVFGLYVLLTAFVFARLEIEIEGPNGWAANLPTWRITNRWTKLIYSNRPLTGYHLWMQIFVLLLTHIPMAMHITHWSWRLEAVVMAFYIWFFIIEDFLWFVLNPAYGVARFRKQYIWWHAPTWWWIMPRDYWVYGAIGIGLYVWGSSVLPTKAAGPATQGSIIAFDVYDGYFVSNQFEPTAARSFVVLRNRQEFDQVLGAAVVMKDKSHRLPDDVFDTRMVVTAIKREKAMVEFSVQEVVVENGVLSVRYTTRETPSNSADFACPLIVSVPKGNYTSVEFVENGQRVKVLDVQQH